MSKRRLLGIILIVITLGVILIIPYFPLYFGDLGTVIENYDLDPSFGDLSFTNPVDFQFVSINDTNIIIYRLFIVEQRGVIYEITNYDSSNPSKLLFLDIQDIVSSGGEKGLLGLTFDPNFENNGYFYVDYTALSPLRTVISRFTVDQPLAGLPISNSEKVILEVNQPYDNHNAGQILFGLDGYLYIGLGDGGLANDPDENGQDRSTLLGSILRIDVNISDNLNYKIPQDNPFFANTKGYREEIYAYGLRNPWRMSQDPLTGYFYIGDVGQNKLEEINVLIPNGGEKNFGWDKKEGKECFLALSCEGDFIDPIIQYPRSDGISVTGGYVYNGDTLNNLQGYYIYGDYWSGRVWALHFDGSKVTDSKLLLQYEIKISTFGLNWNGDILVVDYNAGIIYTLVNVNQ